uniref:Uncharacterized protein n=1 Tax=Utricularia reniformis TaxID=192314 RepID=A0A1Y0B1U3_9LAMI|nr:hypothetical protein AEK19_MT1141 [Utricularia reniformis]ART31357.1 hypothetical protein AEK19_MT1141 [Utricularia reniformis]
MGQRPTLDLAYFLYAYPTTLMEDSLLGVSFSRKDLCDSKLSP